MNVGRAYQFFSKQTAPAMKFYHTRPEMQGSESTIKFIERVADLIHAFSSRTGKSALRKYETRERQVIREFIDYLKKGLNLCSDSGMKGLLVTCSVAIELSDFLLFQCAYDYVMLTRLNQDNLERFFSMVRAFCGNNDNPDPQMFLLIFRLMMVYSLVKPAKGSNVTGEELFSTLCQDSELEDDTASNQRRSTWERINELISRSAEEVGNEESTGNMVFTEDDRLLERLAGYVGMKASRVRNCAACARTLSVSRTESFSQQFAANSAPSFIELTDYHSVLHYPTKSLFSLISILEKNVRAVIGPEGKIVEPDTFFLISQRLEILPSLPTVGCEKHEVSLCGYVVQFYLVLRMHFAVKAFNSSMNNCNKAAEMRKIGKMLQGSGASSTIVRPVIEGIDSCAVVTNTEDEKNVKHRSRKTNNRITAESLARKMESYADTIEEVVAKFKCE